jgi:hypothetical protein
MKKSYPSLVGFNDIVGEDYTDYGNALTILAKIDRMLTEINGTDPNAKICINPHHTSYLYNSLAEDIRPYLEPILTSTPDMDNDMAKTVEKIWFDMMKKGLVKELIEKISADFNCSAEIQSIVGKYVILDSDLYKISELIEKACKFNIMDNSLTKDLLLSSRESAMEHLKYIDRRLNFLSDQLEHEIKMERAVCNHGFDNVMLTFKEYEFERVYVDPYSVKLLRSMNDEFQRRGINKKNLEEEPAIVAILALEFGKDREDVESESIHWPSFWAFSQMKRVYQEGWERWVKLFFLNRGVGLSSVGFDRCLELGSEHGSLWHLNNNKEWPSNRYSTADVLKIADDRIMTKLKKHLSSKDKD